MPLYDYECTGCGGFALLRPIAERAAPAACPGCGGAAMRIIAAPALRAMDGSARAAHDRNERSAQAPATLAEWRARHGAGCGCCARPSGGAFRGAGGERAGRGGERGAAPALKTFSGRRPWQISH